MTEVHYPRDLKSYGLESSGKIGIKPVSTAAAKPPFGATFIEPRLDSLGRLDQDLVCRRCAYNLRGLSPDTKCPECGTAIGRSIHGDLLRFSDPEWVKTLAKGMNWIVAGLIIGVIGGMVGGFLIAALGVPLILLFILQMGLGAIGLIGYWKVSTPDPGEVTTTSGLTARSLVRITQVTSYLLAPLNALQPYIDPIILAAVSVIAGLIGVIGIFAICTHAEHLANRIPDGKLATSSRSLKWGFAVILMISLVMGIAFAASSGPPLGAVGGCVIGAVWIVLFIMALITIIRFRRAFSEAAQTATLSWAALDLPPKMPPPIGISTPPS